MANDAINEMISAFALGCMDKENFKQFRNYIENGGDLPSGLLGDFQNIISLIPTILDIDYPRDELKNELGKQLIEIQKNIQNKEIEERRETRIEAEDDFLQRDASTKIFDVSEKRLNNFKQSKIENIKKMPSTKTIVGREEAKHFEQTKTKDTHPQKSNSLSIVLLWIFSSVLFFALSFLYYLLFDKTEIISKENEHLSNQIVKLRTDLSRTNSFINENKEFVEFFNYPNISIIQLKGLEKKSQEKGRLFISFDAGEGLLHLQNMPRIDVEKNYQLWLVARETTFSLGTFEITPDKKYIRFSEIPFVMKDDIQLFRITIEEKGVSEVSNGETILFGTIQKIASSKKRKR